LSDGVKYGNEASVWRGSTLEAILIFIGWFWRDNLRFESECPAEGRVLEGPIILII